MLQAEVQAPAIDYFGCHFLKLFSILLTFNTNKTSGIRTPNSKVTKVLQDGLMVLGHIRSPILCSDLEGNCISCNHGISCLLFVEYQFILVCNGPLDAFCLQIIHVLFLETFLFFWMQLNSLVKLFFVKSLRWWSGVAAFSWHRREAGFSLTSYHWL